VFTRVIQVEERPSLHRGLPLSIQHLFAMFSASILVPALLGVNPSVVLLMNGIGTLIYLFICKGKVPAFLGSSFAFISPVLLVLGSNHALWATNYHLVLGGFIAAGGVFVVVALLVKLFGIQWLRIILPASVMGPVIALIGLELGSVAAKMAGFIPDAFGGYDYSAVIVAVVTLAIAIFGAVTLRGFFSVIPILTAIIVGYVMSMVFGLVNFNSIKSSAIFGIPQFTLPVFDLEAVLIILPAALVVISEHIGHFVLTEHIVRRDLMKNPGLHRSLLGDGISTMLSGMVGSVPTTTYGENISVMTITKVFSVWVIGGAAVISVVLAFFGKLAAVIQSIPVPVMGGISLFLFGIIAAAGIRVLIESRVDYAKNKNLVLSSIVFILGISGSCIKIGTVQIKGMVLATLVGIVLSTMFFLLEKLKWLNE
jgi:uracil permease